MGLLDSFKSGNGLFGLGGMGGMSGGSIQPSLLGGYYNPAEQKKAMLKQALLGAGLGLLQGGVGSTGQVLGQGLAGGLQGAATAKDDYVKQAMFQRELQQQNLKQKQDAEDRMRADRLRRMQEDFVKTLPQNQQSYATAYPEQAGSLIGKQMFPKAASDGSGDWGVQPIITQDKATGKYHLYQPSKNGEDPKEMVMPYDWTPRNQFLDLGTGYQQMPTQGAPPAETPLIQKDLSGAESLKTQGDIVGKIKATLPQAKQKMETALTQIEQIKNHPGLKSAVGTWQGTELGGAIGGFLNSDVADFRDRILQQKGGSFLQAYETLKGAGGIANAEGAKAEQAIARLSTAKSEADFITALDDYSSAIKNGYAAMEQQAGVQPDPQQGGNNLKSKYGLE